jgi:hypothetical protein
LNPIKHSEILRLPKDDANSFIKKYHYSGDVMPRLTKERLGIILNNKIVAVLSLGWGTRPLHTIQKLFNDCNSQDYFEIGKMCLHDDLPKNSETIFLSKIKQWLIKNYPEKKFLFTWSDGIVGKVGYVYQAFNMYYGGFIETDVYVDSDGHKIHPRTAQGIIKKLYGQKKHLKMGQRPTFEQRIDLQFKRVKGKQFRYILPLNKRYKKMIKKSKIDWSYKYPKENSLEWKVLNPNKTKYFKTKKLPFKIVKKLEIPIIKQKNQLSFNL